MSLPIFALFVGDLPGKPEDVFAFAAAVLNKAKAVEDSWKMTSSSDGETPSWKGASFDAFEKSKNESSEDLKDLCDGLYKGSQSLTEFAWALQGRQKAVAECRASVQDCDRQIQEAPDDQKRQVYNALKPSADAIRLTYSLLFEQTEADAKKCAAELWNFLHVEPLNYDPDHGNLGRQQKLGDADMRRINGQLDNLDSNLVNQGYIGDCYYVAALAAVMRTGKGRRLLKSCVKKHYDASGRQDGYLVTVYDDPLHPDASASQEVFVSDVYAKGTKGSGGKPSAASIFEAAYGQLHPGGTRPRSEPDPGMDGGYLKEGMKDVTGKNARSIDRNKGTLWGLFSGYDHDQRRQIIDAAKNRPVVAGTVKSLPGFGGAAKASAVVTVDGHPQFVKIYSQHAYTVVRADSETVTVRNPWGHNKLIGNSRTGAVMTMTWPQFERYFGSVAVGSAQ